MRDYCVRQSMPSASKAVRSGRAQKFVRSAKLAAEAMRTMHGGDIFPEFTPLQERDVQGWRGQHRAMTQLVEELRAAVVVDVRAYKGQSSIFLARKLKENGVDGFVVAVDSYLCTPEQGKIAEGTRALAFAHDRPMLYKFLTKLIAEGVKETVIPLAQSPIDATRHLRRSGLRRTSSISTRPMTMPPCWRNSRPIGAYCGPAAR